MTVACGDGAAGRFVLVAVQACVFWCFSCRLLRLEIWFSSESGTRPPFLSVGGWVWTRQTDALVPRSSPRAMGNRWQVWYQYERRGGWQCNSERWMEYLRTQMGPIFVHHSSSSCISPTHVLGFAPVYPTQQNVSAIAPPLDIDRP